MAREVRKLSLKERRRRGLVIKASLSIFLLVLCVGGVAYASRIPAVTISHITVNGATAVSPEQIEKVVAKTLEGSYAFLIPRRMSLFVPKEAVRESVLASFPYIKEVRIAKPDMQTIQVSVTEREPYAVWCGERCYGMDKNGFIFTETTGSTTGRIYRGMVKDGPLAATFLPGAFIELDAFAEKISAATKRKVTEVAVHENGDVTCTLLGGGDVRFTLRSERADLLNSIASVFASERLKGTEQFEYADFRFDNKALVKFSAHK